MFNFPELPEVVECFRSFPVSLFACLSILFIVSPCIVAKDLPVFRLQQFDVHGTPYGSRSALFSLEARPLHSNVVQRRCIIATFRQLTVDIYKDLVARSAGALLIIIPKDLNSLSTADRQHLMELEQELPFLETTMPVYLVYDDQEINWVYQQIVSDAGLDSAKSAVEALFNSMFANSYHLVVSGSSAASKASFGFTNVFGRLVGLGLEEQLPTIALVAHYDAFGAAPELSRGADSNGSGAAALLELSRLLARLYRSRKLQPRANILLLLSGAGKFSYLGAKRYIEDHLDADDQGLLADVAFVLCLDSLAGNASALQRLFLHVSKPPKEGNALYDFHRVLHAIAASHGIVVETVHKKINLADDWVHWEHERFSMRRLTAATVSAVEGYADGSRRSITDREANANNVERAVSILGQSLLVYLFGPSLSAAPSGVDAVANATAPEALSVPAESLAYIERLMQPSAHTISSLLKQLTAQPRAAQLMSSKSVVVALLTKWLGQHVHDVKTTTYKPEQKDPELQLYVDGDLVLNAYSAKPAVFDLFLALVIAGYLALVYLFVLSFDGMLGRLKSSMLYRASAGAQPTKEKAN